MTNIEETQVGNITSQCAVDNIVEVETATQLDYSLDKCVTIIKKNQHSGLNKSGKAATNPPPGFNTPSTVSPTIIPPSLSSMSQSVHSYRELQFAKRRNNVLCANCGGMGHIYKNCNHPIISYGVICYRLAHDTGTNTVTPEYLMVQRKDSLSYVEFIRGRYNIKSKSYILEMFSLMTEGERQGVATHSFEKLWQDLWCKNICDENKNFSKEYKEAAEKFLMLKKGYYIKCGEERTFFSIQHILETTISRYNETEWGFPKGRRNINEGDISCALREFKEESGILPKHIQLCHNIKPLEEVFSGSNTVRYKHVYYIGQLMTDVKRDVGVDPLNKQQCKEIKSICWFDYNTAQSKIRGSNVERKELFRRLNQLILRCTHS